MKNLENSINDQNTVTDMQHMQQTPVLANYPHRHCYCMQPLILVIRQTTFTTFSRRNDREERPYTSSMTPNAQASNPVSRSSSVSQTSVDRNIETMPTQVAA